MSLAGREASLSQVSPALATRRRHSRAADFLALTKPRVMSLVVFTAWAGVTVAPGAHDAVRDLLAVLCIAVGAGGAGALNMWYDADVDALMARTARRPIPNGRVSRAEALTLGLILSIAAVSALAVLFNPQAAALLAFTVFFYAVVYTMWLKRRTPQNIVIGGAAGALPPAIGWVAMTGRFGIEPIILFLIIFLWTPAHFWALSLNHAGDYQRAGIPMLPVVAGRTETKRQILIYSVSMLPVSAMPWVFGFAGPLYGVVAVALASTMIVLAVRLRAATAPAEARAASRLFAFSIVFLFSLFALLMAGTPSP